MNALQTFVSNPNPNFYLRRPSSMALSHQICSPSPVRFDRFHLSSRPAVVPSGPGVRFLALDFRRRSNLNLSLRGSFVAFAASNKESHGEIEVEKERAELEMEHKLTEKSQEAWKQTLKEHALELQGRSQEAYQVYSKKAIVILMEASKQLQIQSEKANRDLLVVAKELSEDGKEYLSAAAEKSPESVKDIFETFISSPDELREMSEVREFYIGIPYGLFLSVGGFLSFMLTGSISAIRFGVVLGGALLALSISSLRSWNRGEASAPLLKGQAAIATIIFLRELRLLSQRSSVFTSFMTLISGIIVVFYLYRIVVDGQRKGPSAEQSLEN